MTRLSRIHHNPTSPEAVARDLARSRAYRDGLRREGRWKWLALGFGAGLVFWAAVFVLLAVLP